MVRYRSVISRQKFLNSVERLAKDPGKYVEVHRGISSRQKDETKINMNILEAFVTTQ